MYICISDMQIVISIARYRPLPKSTTKCGFAEFISILVFVQRGQRAERDRMWELFDRS